NDYRGGPQGCSERNVDACSTVQRRDQQKAESRHIRSPDRNPAGTRRGPGVKLALQIRPIHESLPPRPRPDERRQDQAAEERGADEKEDGIQGEYWELGFGISTCSSIQR